jgi:hypothetical protein
MLDAFVSHGFISAAVSIPEKVPSLVRTVPLALVRADRHALHIWHQIRRMCVP